ncbi:hypothetical protein [Algicella marina]|uniref:DUF4410 domain-containing protein n=1 Tax=Algicella marina TaxID=2683284 RepID=A0A6P1SSZ2_9RHOB|nr:hypothetical protein [Algicella marina]QHQ33794.1 hypothetical protein GO499_00675 [Algicella marina]
MLRTVSVLVACAFVLGACAGAAPTKAVLPAETIAQISIVDTTVDVSTIGPQTAGRTVSAADVKAALEREAGVLRFEGGAAATRAQVEITSVNVLTAGQALLVGGESVMRGTVTLVDVATGRTLVTPQEISSGGGGYVLGGIIGAASLEDPKIEVAQMAKEFMRRARLALVGNN